MKKEKTYVLEERFTNKLLEILDNDGCLDDAGDDEVLERFTIDFEDGISVDIDVCNGGRDDNSSPYVNVNWNQDGEDLFAFGGEPEKLLGEYEMVIDDEEENEITYIVNLIIGENGCTFWNSRK